MACLLWNSIQAPVRFNGCECDVLLSAVLNAVADPIAVLRTSVELSSVQLRMITPLTSPIFD